MKRRRKKRKPEQPETSYTCPSCGENIVIPIDISAGEHQTYSSVLWSLSPQERMKRKKKILVRFSIPMDTYRR